MKAIVKVEQTVDVKFLKVKAGVRYWEDSYVNGVNDADGTLIPCRKGDNWEPLIDIDKGQILNWPSETEAEIHYKVCDDGSYYLLDADLEVVSAIENDYVVSMLCPTENGYGDYIIMDIDKNGFIQGWKAYIDDFENVNQVS